MASRIELRDIESVRARTDLTNVRFIYVDATFKMDGGRSHQKIAFLFSISTENAIRAAKLAQALNEAFGEIP